MVLLILVGSLPVYASEEESDGSVPAEETIEAESVALPMETLSLIRSEEYPMYVKITPGDITERVVWSSENEEVATVEPLGDSDRWVVIRAHHIGSTTIRVQAGRVSSSLTVRVSSGIIPAAGVALNTDSAAIVKGKTLKLKASVIPHNAVSETFVWTSSDTRIATVKDGVVTAVVPGTAVITAATADGEFTADCNVKVTVPATKVQLNASSATLGVGETRQLKETMSPANTTDTVTWSTSNSKVATVSKTGTVTPKGAGTATITATTTSGQKAAYKLTVKKAPSSIRLDAASSTLNIKDTKQLKATLSSGSTGTVTWSSSNKSVASVSGSGKITALKAGTATITVKTYNGKSASCKVTVRPNAKSLKLSKSSITLWKNQTSTLKMTYNPSNSKEAVTWSSSNTKVAKVSSAGKVTAVGSGSCYITVKAKNSKVSAQCKVIVKAKQIALTFDDGPKRSTTTRLLNGLKSRGAHATFFLIGQQVPGCKDVVKRMKNEGHEIGSHSYTHAKLTTCSSSKLKSELSQTRTAIKNACASYPTLFRSPYGAYNTTVLNAAGLPHIFWSVDTRDWSTRNTSAVRREIVNGAKDGAIILCHDIYDTTVDGALQAIDDLKKQGMNS